MSKGRVNRPIPGHEPRMDLTAAELRDRVARFKIPSAWAHLERVVTTGMKGIARRATQRGNARHVWRQVIRGESADDPRVVRLVPISIPHRGWSPVREQRRARAKLARRSLARNRR